MIDMGSDHRSVVRFPGTKNSDSQTEKGGREDIRKGTLCINQADNNHESVESNSKRRTKKQVAAAPTNEAKTNGGLKEALPRECFRSGSSDA